jgi:hypothetical protein
MAIMSTRLKRFMGSGHNIHFRGNVGSGKTYAAPPAAASQEVAETATPEAAPAEDSPELRRLRRAGGVESLRARLFPELAAEAAQRGTERAAEIKRLEEKAEAEAEAEPPYRKGFIGFAPPPGPARPLPKPRRAPVGPSP